LKLSGYAAMYCLFLSLLVSGCRAPAATAGAAAPTPIPAPVLQPTIVSLTFDDGDADNFQVVPVLRQYAMHATFYIPSGLVGGAAYMTWQQLHALQADGHEIGGHTLNHVNIGELDAATLRHEVCDDRQNLLDHGFKPISFAYPFGGYDPAAKQLVRECGYTDARTIGAGPEQTPVSDAYALRAFPYIVGDTDFGKLQRYVAATRKDGGGWVILIFHHVCDACDYFAVRPDVLNKFVHWLAEQQSLGRLQVQTVGEVVVGSASP
jgi:peptidoglycan/xylan/chitin deacetylase (PgdA/CDA1 family)